MKDLFVPYELALKLKELGLDEPCLAKYFQQDGNIPFIQIGKSEIEEAENAGDDVTFKCDAPLYQQVIDWLESEKGILIDITHDYYFKGQSINVWHIKIMNKWGLLIINNTDFEFASRKEALTKAIEETLKFIK